MEIQSFAMHALSHTHSYDAPRRLAFKLLYKVNACASERGPAQTFTPKREKGKKCAIVSERKRGGKIRFMKEPQTEYLTRKREKERDRY